MALKNAPVVETRMLIRKPVAEVFEAFVDPAITTRFWFSKSSGRLEPGRSITWEWEMYGISAQLDVIAVEPDKRILIEWDDPPCPVEWQFIPHGDTATLVKITNSGFQGSNDEVAAQAIDAMGGFTMVLAGLKALLEHGIRLKLVPDHHPEALTESWKMKGETR